MINQFNTVVNELISEGDDTYNTEVNTSISINIPRDVDLDYHSVAKALVSFDIETEHRSWGIKSVDVNVRRIHLIPIDLTNENGDVVKTLQIRIDPTQLQTTKEPPTNHIGVDELEIVVDMNGVVDYSRSSIKTFGF